jgi:serine/threonine protein phosphatase PrpC
VSRKALAKPLTLHAAGITDKGPKRSQNEDCYLCDPEQGLFIVADGMGGKSAGELASKAVVTVLPAIIGQTLETVQEPSSREIGRVLTESLTRLSHDLYDKSKAVLRLSGLGSTAVVLLIRQGVGYLAFAGDSRGYFLRGNKLICLTADQTTAAALVRAGHFTPDAAAESPLRHALEEYVGKQGRLLPGIRTRKLRPRDRFLLCSDGITKGLSDGAIGRILEQRLDPEKTCRELIKLATEADGSDNMTAVAVDVCAT